jgi:single-strand DNA-binding protein
MALEVIGKLHKKFATESRGTSGFQTRDFVLEIMDGSYSQLVKFQLLKERCILLDNFKEEEEVKVHFDLRGREWQGKYLTNLNCWSLVHATGDAKPVAPTQKAAAPAHHAPAATTTTAPSPAPKSPMPTVADAPSSDGGDDDLPF